MDLSRIKNRIFREDSSSHFEELALEIFRHQAKAVPIYAKFLDILNVDPSRIDSIENIPFLPVRFFKTHSVNDLTGPVVSVFTSSGTTGQTPSRHEVIDPDLYRNAYMEGFRYFYGEPTDYRILALLPSYLERKGSSLIDMVRGLIEASGEPESGFFLDDLATLSHLLEHPPKGKKNLLIGVSFALLDLAERSPIPLNRTLIMETGGMKGRRKELVRDELHSILRQAFSINEVHSEYGMTELLSQAYSKGEGKFKTPPWIRVLIRDTDDPFSFAPIGRTGGINVIDLANLHSCSFLELEDLGRKFADDTFEVLGRFDTSEVRGCNLMVSDL
ncbi:MAG: acyl transferase [Bacteroidota bacterium]|mgnify:FL=1|nr:acyl transferase [Bacteroidota bacterium]